MDKQSLLTVYGNTAASGKRQALLPGHIAPYINLVGVLNPHMLTMKVTMLHRGHQYAGNGTSAHDNVKNKYI
jgi:hypothetical protein